MGKGQQDKPTEEMPLQEPVTRTARFWAGDMELLAKMAAREGKSEWDEVRYLIRERVSGRCIILSKMKPEFLGELHEFADEHGVDLEDGVKMILSNFVRDRRDARKTAKKG